MIVVTGGCGFIGSNLVKALNDRGRRDIIIVDPLWKTNKRMEVDVFGYIKPDEFHGIIEDLNIECIFHLGAETSTTAKDAYVVLMNNYVSTKDLIAYAVNHNTRFIYASSAAPYGNGPFNEQFPIRNLKPLNLYGYSKHLVDLYAKDLNVVGLKYFNVYGPGEEHKGEMKSMVGQAIEQIHETGKVRLFKHGQQERDFIYVKDVVNMTLHFFDNPKFNGIYNIGTGHSWSFNEMVKAVFEELGLKPDIEYFDMPEALRWKYQNKTRADMTKFYSTGYRKLITPQRDAIRDYVRYYLGVNNVSDVRNTDGCSK